MKINEKTVSCENDILFVLDAVASGEEEFAILAKSPKRFIQTSGNMLEYNSGQKLYSAANISNEDIKAAFLDYYRGNDGYKKFFRKTSAKAEKETFSDIVRETWHDFLDICIFRTVRFTLDGLYVGISLSSWLFYGFFIGFGTYLISLGQNENILETPYLPLGGAAILSGLLVLLGNISRKRAKIESGMFYPDPDYDNTPFLLEEIKCVYVRQYNRHCQLGVLKRNDDFSLLSSYSGGLAWVHGKRLAQRLNRPLKSEKTYQKMVKNQQIIIVLLLVWSIFLLALPLQGRIFVGTLFLIAISKRLYELILGMIYQNADSSATKTNRKSIFGKNKRWYCGDSSYSSHRLIFSEDRITVRPSWVRVIVFCGYGASLGMICSLCLLSDYAIRQYGELVFCIIALLFAGILLSYLFLRSYPEIDFKNGVFYPYGKRGSIFRKKFVAVPLGNVSAIDLEHHSYISRHNCFECFTLLLVVPNGGRNYRYMLLNHGDYPTFMTDAEKLSKRLALPLPDAGLEDFNRQWIRRYSYIALIVYPVFIFIAVGHMNLAFQEKNLFLITVMVIVLASLIYSLFKIVQALKGK